MMMIPREPPSNGSEDDIDVEFFTMYFNFDDDDDNDDWWPKPCIRRKGDVATFVDRLDLYEQVLQGVRNNVDRFEAILTDARRMHEEGSDPKLREEQDPETICTVYRRYLDAFDDAWTRYEGTILKFYVSQHVPQHLWRIVD